MNFEWKPTGKMEFNSQGWEVSTFEVNINLSEYFGDEEDTFPTSILYEFFDENDDLLPNQESYASTLSFKLGRHMKNKIHDCSMTDIKKYHDIANDEEKKNKIKEKFNGNNKGRLELVDFYIDYEIKGTYCIMYFQYKVKPVSE